MLSTIPKPSQISYNMPKYNHNIEQDDENLSSNRNVTRSRSNEHDALNEILKENQYSGFENKSVYTEDYLAWKTDRMTESCKPDELYQPSANKFESLSSYKADYLATRSLERTRPILPNRNPLEFGQDNDSPLSSYRHEYKALKGEKVASYRPENQYTPTENSEKMSSSYNYEYIKKDLSPTQSFKPVSSYQLPTERFADKSNYAETYLKTGRLQPTISFKPPNSFSPSSDPFESNTSYKDGFKMNRNIKLAPIENFKPKSEYHLPSVAMEANSSYNSDFQRTGKSVKMACIRPNDEYKPPEDQYNELRSSYNSDFYGHKKSPRIEPIKQKNQIEISHEPFTNSTDYQSQYSATSPTRLAGHRPDSFRPMNAYNQPTEPFAGHSNYSSDFFKRNNLIGRTKPIIHQGQLEISRDIIDYGTETGHEFIKKRPDPQPTAKKQLATIDLSHPK